MNIATQDCAVSSGYSIKIPTGKSFLHKGNVAMVEIGYVTAKNLFQPEDLPPHQKVTAAVARKAHKDLSDIRKSVKEILDYAVKGAKDLVDGDYWSDNINLFESHSMEQARALSKFPIGINHPKLGPRVFHARAAFVAFRESVRWEVVGKIHPDMPQEDYTEILDLVTEYAKQATDSMLRVERALEKFEA